MLKIGVTGGIGAGKSTVCKLFEVIGIPVYYADDRAKLLMQKDAALIAEITATFGDQSYVDGQLNRSYLSEKVFKDTLQLQKLNALVHPAVRKDVLRWVNDQKNVSYVIQEAALLFESGGYKQLDKMITVHAALEDRIKRLKERDNSTDEQIAARMRHQMQDEEKMRLADFVVYNDQNHSLIKQVLTIHHLLVKESEHNTD